MIYAWIGVGLSAIGIIVIPGIIAIRRSAAARERIEEKLESVIEDLKELIKATDRRLRWLEENIWRRGR